MRFLSAVTIAVIATVPCSLNAHGQGTASDGKGAQQTGDMQTLIKIFSGHWSLRMKFEPSKEVPGGLESTGDETWHASPGGLVLTDDEVFAAGPQTAIVIGLLWQDLKTKEFHAMECSNQMSSTCDLKGAANDVVVHWTGSELTIDEKELSQGTMMTSRVAWSDITPNSFTETGYLAPPGGTFRKVMTVHATRATDK